MTPMLIDQANYSTDIAWSEDRRMADVAPEASVVIVAYNTNQLLIDCLESLRGQSNPRFETIVVDNGKNEQVLGAIKKYPILYVALKKNYRPSLARNVGIAYASSEIVCFLDDDAIAHPGFVEEHLQANRLAGIMGVRGKVLPKSQQFYNCLATFYNLGNTVVPSYIDLEGNASFPRHVLLEVNGFNPQVFAGEGAELSYRIVKRFGNSQGLIYWPSAVIYHDYAAGFLKYHNKLRRGAKMNLLLEHLYPDYKDFIESYHPLPQGDTPQPRNFRERLALALLRRTGNLVRKGWQGWYRWRNWAMHRP